MKKAIVCLLLMALLVGCAETEPPSSSVSSLPQETASSQPSKSQTSISVGVFGEKSADYRAEGYRDNILFVEDATTVSSPSTISLFIGEEHDEIGFIYEYGLGITEEDAAAGLPKDEYGNHYLYYGKLTHLENNIYSVSGEVIPSWSVLTDHVKEGVDFYLIFHQNRFDLVLEELPVEEMEHYRSDKYYVFNND